MNDTNAHGEEAFDVSKLPEVPTAKIRTILKFVAAALLIFFLIGWLPRHFQYKQSKADAEATASNVLQVAVVTPKPAQAVGDVSLSGDIQPLQSTQLSGLNNQFRMGVYSFYSDVTVLSSNNKTNYTPDNGMLTDLNAVNAAASNLQLTPYRSDGNFFLTDFPAIYRSMNKIVTNPGDGSKPSKPEKFVFFVTDGVQDLPLFHPDGSTDPKYTQYDNTEGWGHAIAPIDSNICTALKNRGVKIAVLYTPFLATSAGASPLSDKDIVFWKNDIPAKLQGCASPNFFYTATSAGIAAAMNQMFQDALRSARLTQ